MVDRVKTEWPDRIHVSQEGYSAMYGNVYNADTGEQLMWVLELHIEKGDSTLKVTQSKYVPPKPTFQCTENDPDLYEPMRQGIVCWTREYPIFNLSIDAGVKHE